MTISNESTSSWRLLVATDRAALTQIMQAWVSISPEDQVALLRHALSNGAERATALRLLLYLDDESRKVVFPELVRCAAYEHRDIVLCRDVIKVMPRDWTVANIDLVVKAMLDETDESSHRRYAELYQELDQTLLATLVRRMESSSSESVREIADDYRSASDPHKRN